MAMLTGRRVSVIVGLLLQTWNTFLHIWCWWEVSICIFYMNLRGGGVGVNRYSWGLEFHLCSVCVEYLCTPGVLQVLQFFLQSGCVVARWMDGFTRSIRAKREA